MNDSPDYANPGLPASHHLTHENDAQDEIDVSGLSGELTDEQDAGKIKGKTVDPPTAPEHGKFLKYDHSNAKYTHDILTAPGGPFVLSILYDSIVHGTFVNTQDFKYFLNCHVHNSSSDDGDQIDYKLWLGAGTYTFKLLHAKNTTFGILKILIDAVEKVTIDCYGSLARNVISTTTGINIPTTGSKTISFKIAGKNPLSTDYYMNVTAFVFYRTA